MTKPIQINVFAPTKPHIKQNEVLDDPSRFKVLRAGRKWRKTSLGISWLFEGALLKGLTFPYIAPNQKQARNIAWRDHIVRMTRELVKKKVPHKVNEVEMSVSFPNNGRVQLLGVENREALRGISNWGGIFGDEVDDWQEDIWPSIIRPNLITHKAPAIMAGTPKGERILFNLAKQPEFKEFHYTSYDNPDIDPEELEALVREYRTMGEDYFKQEILAEYVMPVGLVYRDWKEENYREFSYNVNLPVHVAMDFGVNDPTAIVWLQVDGGEYRVFDYYEASNANIDHFIQMIRSKPYREPELYVGDPAGKARTLTTGTSPIELLAQSGIHVRTKDGVKIPEQIRATHKIIPSLFVSSSNPNCEHFKTCLRNYRYPELTSNLRNQENEIPIHDQFCVVGDTKIRTLNGWHKIRDLVGKEFYVWSYSLEEKRIVPAKTSRCWLAKKNAEIVEIGLDDGQKLQCTPDHKIMLRTGKYRQAQDLETGDSLMPFYEWKTGDKQHTEINLNDGSRATEHRYVFSRLRGNLQEELVIDHVDGNHKNNNPNNLQQITIDAHCKKTSPHLAQGSAVNTRTGIRTATKKCIWCGNDFHAFAKELTCSNECAIARTQKYSIDYQRNYRAVRKQNHKVTYVKLAGKADVYDITVPGTHNFVANGVVISNSHAMRALEYYAVNIGSFKSDQPKSVTFKGGDSLTRYGSSAPKRYRVFAKTGYRR